MADHREGFNRYKAIIGIFKLLNFFSTHRASSLHTFKIFGCNANNLIFPRHYDSRIRLEKVRIYIYIYRIFLKKLTVVVWVKNYALLWKP